MTPLRARLRPSGVASGVGSNALSLYSVQLVGYVFPLLVLPYLARVLGPQSLGLLGLFQSLALWLVLVVEYGFQLSATREIARLRGDSESTARVVAGVVGAKALLAVASLLLCGGLTIWVPVFHNNPAYLFWAWSSGIAQALSPWWYFQGIEQMRGIATIDIITRAISTLAVLLVVRSPEGGIWVLAFQALASAASTGAATWWMFRNVAARVPALSDVTKALRMGLSMFFFRSTVGLYTTANTLILGLLAPPVLVGYFSGAEKMTKGAIGLVGAASQALFPRMSHLVSHDPPAARRLLRTSALLMVVGAVCVSALLGAPARLWVRILLGPEYNAAVPVLRLMVLLVPLIALSNILGVQWMLPHRMDKAFNGVVVLGAIVNLTLAIALAPRFGASGMALAVVGAEASVTLGMYTVLRLRGLHPF